MAGGRAWGGLGFNHASRRANRFSQSAISQSPQRRNRMSKATSETSTTPLAAASAASLRKDRPPGA